MNDPSSLTPRVCPVCATPVEGKLAGIWTGYDRKRQRGCGGPGYEAVCKKCGVELESFPTDEENKAGLIYWGIREPRVHVKQHKEEKAELEKVLKPFLEAHAKREQVMDRLSLEFADFTVGSNRHSELKKWLFLDEVSEAAARFPGIFFHTNARTMTWLFFDAEQRLQGFFIRSA